MNTILRVFIIEDTDDDAELLLSIVRHGGFDLIYTRIQTKEELVTALQEQSVDIILSDYTMPNFSGSDALRIVRGHDLDTPFIFISGTIGEDIAVESMHLGANDYIMKDNVKKLIAVIRRELSAAEIRKANKRSQSDLQLSEDRYRNIVELLSDAIIIHRDDIIIFANQSAILLFAATKDNILIGKTIWELLPSDKHDIIKKRIKIMEDSNLDNPKIELSMIRLDGKLITVEATLRKINYENKSAYYVILHDITDSRQDPVTALPNRFKFEDDLTTEINLLNEGDQLAILFLNIDVFSTINEAMGYAGGDKLLKSIAMRLSKLMTITDQLARFEADQFAIRLNDINKIEDVVELVSRIKTTIAQPFTINSQKVSITMSIGISMYPTDGVDAQSLMKNANIALKTTRQSGADTFQFCTPAMTSKAKERISLENDLRLALSKDQFELNYQPIIELPLMRIKGMEALLRWNRNGTIVSPKDFIPITESTHLIVPIGEWIIHKACQQGKIWSFIYPRPIFISVNMSVVQFKHHGIIDTLNAALNESQFDPECLKLEITESMIMDDITSSIKILHKIKDMGIKISIDDFGTGYSSLSYLRQLPIDSLKIDQSFIRDMIHNNNDAAIVKTIISLADNLGFSVIAEGVETEEQLSFINKLGCDQIQGYYFSRPMKIDAASEYIKNNASKK